MDTKALLQLAEDLWTRVPVNRFYMDEWVADDDCGFAGCGVGWFCHFNPGDRLHLAIAMDGELSPFCDDAEDFDAIALRFDVSRLEAVFLFGMCDTQWMDELLGLARELQYDIPCIPRTEHPHTTAARIRKFVACKLAWDARDMTPGIVHRAANLVKPRVESVVVAG